jgi:glycosyltransferase involved in cell wall biosynthesis
MTFETVIENTRPTVSVVVPAYNVEKYLRVCLDSILAQSLTDFEVIVVNDGSTDQTQAICESYCDPRIRLINQQNRGLAAARNTGIRHARAKLVAFLDSDDFWHSDKLFMHVTHLNANPHIGVSYSGSTFVDDDGKEMGIAQKPKLTNIDARDLFCRNPIGNGSAPVIRKTVLDQVAFRGNDASLLKRDYFDENLRQSEDVELWVRIALSTSWQFEGLKECLTYYRVNNGGLSANLYKQFAAWQVSVQKHQKINHRFVSRWGGLAAAYQYRYLSRRAVQLRDGKAALGLLFKSLKKDKRVLLEEKGRTLLTFASAFCLLLLPLFLYEKVEAVAMNNMHAKRC